MKTRVDLRSCCHLLRSGDLGWLHDEKGCHRLQKRTQITVTYRVFIEKSAVMIVLQVSFRLVFTYNYTLHPWCGMQLGRKYNIKKITRGFMPIISECSHPPPSFSITAKIKAVSCHFLPLTPLPKKRPYQQTHPPHYIFALGYVRRGLVPQADVIRCWWSVERLAVWMILLFFLFFYYSALKP